MTETAVAGTAPVDRTLAEQNARVRRVYDRSARRYDRQMARAERWMLPHGRQWAASRARGEVLELGIGTGRNLAHYRPDVEVTGVDLSTEMLAVAAERAQRLGRHTELRCADAQDLPWPPESFDTVVSTLSLCSVPDDQVALSEAWRVLRPGGRLVVLEHVRSPIRAVRIAQELLEPIALATQHDHLLREPLDAARCQGFVVDELHREKLGYLEFLVAHKQA